MATEPLPTKEFLTEEAVKNLRAIENDPKVSVIARVQAARVILLWASPQPDPKLIPQAPMGGLARPELFRVK
jgi:hypothetical protein